MVILVEVFSFPFRILLGDLLLNFSPLTPREKKPLPHGYILEVSPLG
jgi:hypothetical protein